MGDIGGAAQAGASMIDTAATDATNIAMQKQSEQFNDEQARAQRAWAGDQAQKQMDFNSAQAAATRGYQTSERLASQAYNTQMSDTQVQRRAQDISAAGFNPLLAVGQLGGASSPTSQPMSGATATAGLPSGSAASSPGLPQIRGLVPGAIEALNSQAQRSQALAQTANTDSVTALNRAKLPYAAAQAAADVGRTNQEIDTLVSQANKNLSEYDINEQNVQNLLQDKQFRAQLQQGLMELQSLDIQAKRYGNAEGAARADVFNSPLGRYLVVAGLGHQAGGDVGAAAATALWQLYQNPVKPKTKSAMDVQVDDPTGAHMLEESGISAPTP